MTSAWMPLKLSSGGRKAATSKTWPSAPPSAPSSPFWAELQFTAEAKHPGKASSTRFDRTGASGAPEYYGDTEGSGRHGRNESTYQKEPSYYRRRCAENCAGDPRATG